MKKNLNLIIWLFLVFLTVSSAIVSSASLVSNLGVLLVLVLSGIKFIGVAFYFMEINKAHIFWKVFILGYLVLFSSTVIMLLN